MVWGRVLFIGLKGEIKKDFENELNCLEWATRNRMVHGNSAWLGHLGKEVHGWKFRMGLVYFVDNGPMRLIWKCGLGVGLKDLG